MQVNFIEELVAEWFEYKGYFVKRNERVGRRNAGGHEGELDVVAFNPKTNHVLHVETSTDASSWKERETRFAKKFSSGDKYIRSLFDGLEIPRDFEKRAIFAIASDRNHKSVGGGRVQSIADFIVEVLEELKRTSFFSRAVPEKYPIIRVLQMITEHKERVVEALNKGSMLENNFSQSGEKRCQIR